MAGPNWKLHDDLKTVTITFPTKPVVVLKIDTAELEKMLQALGQFRAMMQPEIEKRWPLGSMSQAIPDPAWATEPDQMYGASLLHLRDPRYGWLHYLLPPHEARKLGELLIAQADIPPPGPVSGKAS